MGRARREEIAWAAGLFEGEGCITQSSGQSVLRLNSTDLDVLERFHAAVGRGEIYGPYENRPSRFRRKPFWVWVCPRSDAVDVIAELGPWLGSRRLARARELGVFPWN
jgi:hypothetical protein